MDHTDILASIVISALSFAAMGCGTTKPLPPAQTPVSAPPQHSAPTGMNEPAPAVNTATASVVTEPAKAVPGKPIIESSKSPTAAPTVAKEPTPTPVAAASSSKAPSAPAPAPAAEPASSPVAPAASTHAHVGPEKCMMCHRLQYNSWNESKHKAKGLDCEGCHGNGADYKTISVMKDLAAAKKAGLIIPGLGFCKKCHVKADASFLPTAHAHKAK